MKTPEPILRKLLTAAAVSALAMTTGAHAAGYGSDRPDRSEASSTSSGEMRSGDMTTTERGAAGTTSGSMQDDADSRSAETRVSDQALETRVKAALIGDDRTKARDIEVEVRNGTVNLSGTVDSAAEAEAAQEVARQVSGVGNVTSSLSVGGAR